MYEYDDGEGGGRSIGRVIAVGVGVVVLALVGFLVVRSRSGGDDAGGETVTPASGGTEAEVAADDGSTTTVDAGDDSVASNTDDDASADDPTTTRVTARSAASTTTSAASRATATTGASTTAATTVPPTAAPTTPAAVAAPPAAPTYDTLPDGSPVPVLALYGPDKITLTGAVPDEAAKNRLEALAIANAKPGQDTVENFLTLNPDVPRNIGTRVVELTSVRFPEGSAEVLPPHAIELNRVAAIMNALPNITTLVIGHADQRGDELANYALSEERADSVVNYIASQGVDPSRLSSRAVGEADLLTLNNEPAALELNRRTEFVFYGLLLG